MICIENFYKLKCYSFSYFISFNAYSLFMTSVDKYYNIRDVSNLLLSDFFSFESKKNFIISVQNSYYFFSHMVYKIQMSNIKAKRRCSYKNKISEHMPVYNWMYSWLGRVEQLINYANEHMNNKTNGCVYIKQIGKNRFRTGFNLSSGSLLRMGSKFEKVWMFY